MPWAQVKVLSGSENGKKKRVNTASLFPKIVGLNFDPSKKFTLNGVKVRVDFIAGK